jgi:hypothetical protein
MIKKILAGLAASACLIAQATTYDSSTLVDTNSTSTSTSTINTNNVNSGTVTNINQTTVGSTSTNTNTNTSTSTNVNNNNNVNSGTMTNNNNNVNSGTMTYNNNNVNSGTMTNNNNNVNSSTNVNTNNNNNVNSGTMTNINQNTNSGTMTNNNNNVNQTTSDNKNVNVQTGDMTNRNISDITQRVIQPPPTAVAPTMMSGGNADLCTTGTSGSVQTQIFGVSSGGTVRDLNCERVKLSKTLYDMGMKVAAVATMCQDRRIFDAMMAAGTPCPYEGKIGEQARAAWEENPHKIPKLEEVKTDDTYQKVGIGALLGAIVFKLF